MHSLFLKRGKETKTPRSLPHSMGVSPFCKVSLEGLGTLVGLVAADLALVGDVEPVQLVQPVRNWFTVPAQRQVLNREFTNEVHGERN